MSNIRVLELDSTYRNRALSTNLNPGQFITTISSIGRKGKEQALDPVCLSAPYQVWNSNEFSAGTPGSYYINVTIPDLIPALPPPTNIPGPITTPIIPASGDTLAYTNSQVSFVITAMPGFVLQTIPSYYIFSAIANNTTGEKKRIIDYKYVGFTSANFSQTINGITYVGSVSKAIITIESTPSSNFETSAQYYTIADATDLTDTMNPRFYVPGGRTIANGYASDILSNETLNDFRWIYSYDVNTHLLGLQLYNDADVPFSFGPVVGWLPSHRYSLRRREAPMFYGIAAVNSPDNQNIQIQASVGYRCVAASTQNNFYKYEFLRMTSGANQILGYTYSYASTLANACRQITGYNATTGIVTVSPPFQYPIVAGDQLEILPFSYDNANPIVYNSTNIDEVSCYEIELTDLALPNNILFTGSGGQVAFYPFVHIELYNISSSSSGNREVMSSNNPTTTRTLFRVPINDTTNPLISTFTKIYVKNKQVLKFKPNDSVMFSVLLPNGDVYDTIEWENYSPTLPRASMQVSALFTLRRMV